MAGVKGTRSAVVVAEIKMAGGVSVGTKVDHIVA